MEMKEWARREIDIMLDNEAEFNKEHDLYSASCCESAFKAFESLMEDGHSGMSIGITLGILNRLVKGQPLTPIYDDEEAWEETHRANGRRAYQCKRMSSLFKCVHPDGTVTYSDVDRVICVDIDYPDVTYISGLVRDIIDEMFPITMPYYPGKAFKITCHDDILTDAKNGDFDTVAIFGGSDPDGNIFSILRYFKEAGDGWEEITEDEYLEKCVMHEERLAKLQEEQNARVTSET